jgi:hypothetical protein
MYYCYTDIDGNKNPVFTWVHRGRIGVSENRTPEELLSELSDELGIDKFSEIEKVGEGKYKVFPRGEVSVVLINLNDYV